MKYPINYFQHGGKIKLNLKRMIGAADANESNEITNEVYSNNIDINSIIEEINKKKYDGDYEIKDLIWKIEKIEKIMDYIIDNVTYKIGFNFIKLENTNKTRNEKPLFCLPGFSLQSLGWTVSRISKYYQDVFNLGFSDIYIFDFTAIGGDNEKGTVIQSVVKEKLGGQFIDEMYKEIAGFIKNKILVEYNNLSILGRSAGAGLSLHLVLSHKLKVNGLNLACPGVNIKAIKQKIFEYENKNLPIRMCFAPRDKKLPILIDGNINADGARVLNDIFFENQFLDYIYFEVSTPDDSHESNHRIQPILIRNLV